MSATRLKPSTDRFGSLFGGSESGLADSRVLRMREGCVLGSVRRLTVALSTGVRRVLKRDIGHEVEDLALRFLREGRDVPEGDL